MQVREKSGTELVSKMLWRKVSHWCIESDSHRIEKYVNEDSLKFQYRVIRYQAHGWLQFGCADDSQAAREMCETDLRYTRDQVPPI